MFVITFHDLSVLTQLELLVQRCPLCWQYRLDKERVLASPTPGTPTKFEIIVSNFLTVEGFPYFVVWSALLLLVPFTRTVLYIHIYVCISCLLLHHFCMLRIVISFSIIYYIIK